MAEQMFKEKFGNIKKIKICTTTEDINFDNYTEPGSYEIYEDLGNGQSRVYLMTVDKSVSGACLKQTRVHCGIVDARQTTTAGEWSEWSAISGGGSVDLTEYVKSTDIGTEDKAGVFKLASVPDAAEGATKEAVLTPYHMEAIFAGRIPQHTITSDEDDRGGNFPPSADYMKEYVGGIVGDVSSALDELHAYATSLAGGAE